MKKGEDKLVDGSHPFTDIRSKSVSLFRQLVWNVCLVWKIEGQSDDMISWCGLSVVLVCHIERWMD